jgi:hypothetical protein
MGLAAFNRMRRERETTEKPAEVEVEAEVASDALQTTEKPAEVEVKTPTRRRGK